MRVYLISFVILSKSFFFSIKILLFRNLITTKIMFWLCINVKICLFSWLTSSEFTSDPWEGIYHCHRKGHNTLRNLLSTISRNLWLHKSLFIIFFLCRIRFHCNCTALIAVDSFTAKVDWNFILISILLFLLIFFPTYVYV